MARVTDREVNRWLGQFARAVRKKYRPEHLILFGSRARGDHLLESDVDIIIVSEKFAGVPWPRRLGDAAQLWPGLNVIEPLCYTPEEFERKKGQIGIVQQAVKEGVAI